MALRGLFEAEMTSNDWFEQIVFLILKILSAAILFFINFKQIEIAFLEIIYAESFLVEIFDR